MTKQTFRFTPQSSPNDVRNSFQLSENVIFRNGRWFVKLRWLAVAIFIGTSSTAFALPQFFDFIGLTIPIRDFIILAAVLCFANIVFWFLYRTSTPQRGIARTLIWSQIILDLCAITYVVHLAGSTNTPIAFLYTLHIALACVFFKSLASLTVTATASLLYFFCVALEQWGILDQTTVYTSGSLHHSTNQSYISSLSVIGVFGALWYVVSKLSKTIRKREMDLIHAHNELIAAQKEKDEYAKHTTHQLKSPLDCIRSNISLMLEGYVGTVDEKAAEMLQKINNTAEELGMTIMEVLQLSRLKAESLRDDTVKTLDLRSIMEQCITDVTGSAQKRNIEIQTQLLPAPISGSIYHFKMLFNNLLSNAINYSHDNSHIEISITSPNQSGHIEVAIRDFGIGIPEEKVPMIFDEYFKTMEAVKHNNAASGVGLAIVKKIAELHNIEISVESKTDQGTCFTLTF